MNRVIAVIYGVAGLWFLLLASPRSLGEAAVKYAFAAILLFFAYRRFRRLFSSRLGSIYSI